ncbi:MAG: hypothetical protein HZA31_09835 [Opitutae bacterium]|nr:hypothetical protein [Opitutae bacterium]
MNLSKLQLTATLLLAAGVAVAIVLQQRNDAQLRSALDELRQELRATRTAAASAARPTSSASANDTFAIVKAGDELKPSPSEWQQLRQDMETLKVRTQELARTQPPQATDSSGPPPGGFIPVGSLKNAGRGKPTAAVETLLWAATQGEIDTLANSLLLDPNARTKADAWFARLPPESQAQFGSPEKVLATVLSVRASKELAAMGVVSQADKGTDLTLMRVRFQNAEGQQRDDQWPLRLTSDGWKLIVTEKGLAGISKALNNSAGRAAVKP